MIKVFDRVKQITSTSGSGHLTLGKVLTSYQGFSEVFNSGESTYYCIENGANFEVGLGTYGVYGPNTLTRDTVLDSSTGSKLNLAGRSTVFVTVPAAKFAYLSPSGEINHSLSSLNDVSVPFAVSGDALFYNGVEWVTGSASGYTDEQAQDAVAGMLVASTGIHLSYNDGANTLAIAATGLLLRNNNLSDLTNTSTARTNLGLGTAALSNSGDFYLSTNPSGYITASAVGSGYQPLDGDLSSLSAATGIDAIYYRSASDTWSPVVIGTGISFSGGTLSNTLDLSSYATSSGVAASYVPYTGAAGAVNLGSQSLTAGAITASGTISATAGTITTDTPSLNISQTWNGSGVTFSLLKASITPTLTGAGSTWIDFTSTTTWGGNNTPFLKYVPYTGSLSMCGSWGEGSVVLGTTAIGSMIATVYGTGLRFAVQSTSNYVFRLGTHGTFGTNTQLENWTTNNSLVFTGTGLTGALAWDASNVFAQRNGTNVQTFRVYNTFTSATNGEFLQARGVSAANFELGPSNGSAGGTLRGLTIGGYTNGSSTITPWLTFTSGGVATFNVAATLTASSFTSDYGNFSNPSFIIGATSQGFGASGSTLYGRMSSNIVWAATTTAFRVGASQVIGWSSTGDAQTSADAGLARNAAGVVEINNGTAGQYGGLLAGSLTLTQVVATSGSPTFLTATGAAHTTLTASTEATDVNFNLARTVQFAAGALTTQRAFRIQAPTYAFASASTITTASTLSISGAPIAGTNATITNAYALNVESGSSNFQRIFVTDGTNSFESSSWGGAGLVVRSSGNPVVGLGLGGIRLTAGAQILFCSDAALNTPEIGLIRDAANTLAQRSSTNAQTFRIYNTFTSATNAEWFQQSWVSNEIRLGTAVGSAGGTQRNLILGAWDSAGTWIPKLTIVPTVAGGIALGSATADRYCQISYSAGNFSVSGDAQAAKFVLRIKTTDATATTMMLDGSTTRLTIPSGKMMFADIWISGIKSDGSAAATYRRKAAIKNVGGTTSLIGSVETIGTDYEDNVLTDVVITADDTNDALQINVTGIAAETWRWVAIVEGLEIAYGT